MFMPYSRLILILLHILLRMLMLKRKKVWLRFCSGSMGLVAGHSLLMTAAPRQR